MNTEAMETAKAGIEKYTRNLRPDGEALTAYHDQILLLQARARGEIDSEQEMLRKISLRSQKDPVYDLEREHIMVLCKVFEQAIKLNGRHGETLVGFLQKALDADEAFSLNGLPTRRADLKPRVDLGQIAEKIYDGLVRLDPTPYYPSRLKQNRKQEKV